MTAIFVATVPAAYAQQNPEPELVQVEEETADIESQKNLRGVACMLLVYFNPREKDELLIFEKIQAKTIFLLYYEPVFCLELEIWVLR